MTDVEKLLSIGCFMNNEGIRVEDTYRLVLSHRTVHWRECDQLDLLELMELKIRLDYFNELDVVIGNILLARHDPRPPYFPLTGLRYDGTIY